MNPKDKLKQIRKTLNNPEGSLFFTEEDFRNIKWLITRVKNLENAAKDVIAQFNYHGGSLDKLKKVLDDET